MIALRTSHGVCPAGPTEGACLQWFRLANGVVVSTLSYPQFAEILVRSPRDCPIVSDLSSLTFRRSSQKQFYRGYSARQLRGTRFVTAPRTCAEQWLQSFGAVEIDCPEQ